MRLKTCFLMLMTFLIVMSIGISSAFALGANIGNERLGDALLFGYYDTRTTAQTGPNLTDNYFTVTNTSNSYIQGHVRVRTGEKSIELLDFDAMLTPYDVFAFDLYQVNSNIVFASCDTHTLLQSGFTLNYDRDNDGTKDCLIVTSDPASTYYYSNLTSLIKQCSGVSEADAVTQTLKGYVEVLGEGAFILGASDPCKTVPHGKTLYVWNKTDLCDVDTLGDVLMGRVLYADTGMDWPNKMLRLATLNALSISGFSSDEVILHKDNYPLELASPTGPGYAYDAAKTTDPDGAHDMNLCFFTNTIGSPAVDVVNRVGAAATFGPTLADAQNISGRYREILPTPVDWKMTVANVDQLTYDVWGGWYDNSTSTAYSNFFHVVSPPFVKNLMDTSFVFTFPTMHFIDQKTQVTETAAYDTEENDCIIPPGKFISPGLPGQPTLVPEVAITTPTTCSEFAEGWRSFGLNVNSDAVGDKDAFVDYWNDTVADDRNVDITGYAPLAICSMYMNGDDVFDTSPMHKVPGITHIIWDNND